MLEKAIKYFNKREYKKSFPMFLSLSEEGNVEAEYYLGLHYYKITWVVPEDYEVAYKYFKNAALKGHPESLYKLYSYHKSYRLRKYVTLNETDILEYEKLRPIDKLGFSFFDNGVYDYVALNWLFKAINANREEYLDDIHNFYINDLRNSLYKYSKEQINKIIEYYIYKYNKSYVDACSYIGELYENEIGKFHDYEKAFLWYKKGAEKHNLDISCFRLALFYKKGIIVDKDYDKAIYYFKKASINSSDEDI